MIHPLSSLRSLFVLTFSVWLAGSTAFSAPLCGRAFNEDSRVEYREALKNFKNLSDADVQKDVDLVRKIVQSLFIDTKYFLNGVRQGPFNPQDVSPSAIQGQLEGVASQLLAKYTSDTSLQGAIQLKSNGKSKVEMQLREKLSASAVESLVDCLIAIKANPELAGQTLSLTLQKPDEKSVAKIQERKWKAEILDDDRKAISQKRSEKWGGLGMMLSASSVPVFWTAEFFGAMNGHKLPGIVVDSWGYWVGFQDFLLAAGAYPGLAAASGIGMTILYDKVVPTLRIKAAYQSFVAKRLQNKATKTVTATIPNPELVSFERSDAAAERAWATWRVEVLTSEQAQKTADLPAILNRMESLQLIVPTFRLVEMPNGERFKDLLKQDTILTNERTASLARGFERKSRQLEILMGETRWLEHDLNQVLLSLDHPESLPSYADANWIATQRLFAKQAQTALQMLRASLDSFNERFEFIQDRAEAGEAQLRILLQDF